MDFNSLTIKQLHQGLVKKDYSALELTDFYLEQIKEKDGQIGAYLQVEPEVARTQAMQADKALQQGQDINLLTGIPGAIKDAIMVKGFKCTTASRTLENYQAPYDATSVAKLRESSAVFLGKTNLDEFAMGSSTERSALKKTVNPRDYSRVPVGTSGGSAAAVAGGECVFALGSDTGGSIRQPASFCGIVGIKPTYGAVSRYGLIAHASSLDQVGSMAKTVEDCEIVFNTIAGKDEKDSTSIDFKFQISNFKLKNIRIGIPKEYFAEGIEPEVREAVMGTIKKLEKEGTAVQEISLPHTKYALPCYYIISTSEASANLARFDGIRYGFSKGQDNLASIYTQSRGHCFGPEVKRRIMLGTFVLSSGYYDAYYLKAQKVRTLLKQDFARALEQVDFILTPVSPFPAFKLGEKVEDPLKMYLSDIYTISINLAGVPAMSLPCGQASDLPVGLQIVSKPFNEAGIFNLAKTIESLN